MCNDNAELIQNNYPDICEFYEPAQIDDDTSMLEANQFTSQNDDPPEQKMGTLTSIQEINSHLDIGSCQNLIKCNRGENADRMHKEQN